MTKLVGVATLLLIVLAGAASGQQRSAEPRRDVLILRAGGPQEGELQGCSGASCSFSGRPHSRPTILMLGLAVAASDAPPAITDPLQDAVYLRNAVVVKSKLVGIDVHQVVTEQGSQPRANVAWVFLALAPASPGPRGDSPSKTRTYEYDVTFRSVLKEEGTWHLKVVDSAGVVYCCEEREWRMEMTSTATFPNVPITVSPLTASVGDARLAIMSDLDTPTPETTARVTGKWRGFSQNLDNIPTANCEGAKTWDTPARMVTSVNVNQTNNTSSNFAIHVMEARRGDNIQGLLFADCKKIPVGGASFIMRTLTWNGLNVSGGSPAEIYFDQPQARELASPVSELLTGRAFTLDTGTHTFESSLCGDASRSPGYECRSRIRSEQRYVVIFTPKQ